METLWQTSATAGHIGRQSATSTEVASGLRVALRVCCGWLAASFPVFLGHCEASSYQQPSSAFDLRALRTAHRKLCHSTVCSIWNTSTGALST